MKMTWNTFTETCFIIQILLKKSIRKEELRNPCLRQAGEARNPCLQQAGETGSNHQNREPVTEAGDRFLKFGIAV
jgi:hypothetical protein